MAGIPGAFDENAVIAGLHTAMQVGLPPLEEDQPTFFWRPVLDTTMSVDDEGVPFDPTVQQATTPYPSVRVPCAVEYSSGQGKVVDFGVTQASKVILTFVQPDYDQVYDPTKGGMFYYVVIGGDRWFYHHEAVPMGLVTLGIHQVECHAESDS